MRNRTHLVLAALVLASSVYVQAQSSRCADCHIANQQSAAPN